jgi:hypothetical protein
MAFVPVIWQAMGGRPVQQPEMVERRTRMPDRDFLDVPGSLRHEPRGIAVAGARLRPVFVG